MKKFYKILLLILLFFTYLCLGEKNNNIEVVRATQLQPKFTISISAYKDITDYDGSTTGTNLKGSDIVEAAIVEKGGVHEDGEGNAVFSNYVIVTLNYKIDANHKISNQDAYVISDNDMSISGSVYGSSEKVKLQTKIGYGQLFTRYDTAGYGSRTFTNVGITGGKTERLHFTEDGDYHLVSVFRIKEKGEKKKIVIDVTIPIRTSIYLTDLSGVFQVKDQGKYYDDFIVNANYRKNVTIYCNDQIIKDGSIITKDGTYEFEVYGNGFCSEKFTFEKFEDLEIAELYISNIRKKIGDSSYEAECYFSMAWKENVSVYAFITNLEDNIRRRYYQGTEINEVGIYKVELYSTDYGRTQSAYVNLVPGDSPNHNYNTLNGKRFNNFKTKWYEVYDEENNDYLCFDLKEYSTALNAALSIENTLVNDKGYEKEYRGKSYTDSISLTAALNEYAEKNVKIMYYDFEDKTKSKLFSSNLFDETVYINKDFMFVNSHESETYSVILNNLESNTSYNIDFFKEIGSYNLPSGEYEIKETDIYGNENIYYGIIDDTAPSIKLDINGEEKEIKNGDVVNADYFFVEELKDSLDPHAVISINEDFYINNEFYKEVYSSNGIYNIRAYDRNNNFIKCTVIIEKDQLYTISEDDENISLSLKNNVEVIKVEKNNVEVELDSLVFKKETSEVEKYLIYLKNNSMNHVDCVKIQTRKYEEKNENNIDNNIYKEENDGLSKGVAILISSSVFVIFAAIGIVIFIKSKKEGE